MQTLTHRLQLPILAGFIALGVSVLPGEDCRAQGLFGQRTLGRSLDRRTNSPNATATPGTVDQGRRFLRSERTATDFVGSAASGGGTAGFVGGTSAVNTVTSSVTGLREEVRPPLNRPRVLRPTGIYAERLTLDDSLSSASLLATNSLELSESVSSFILKRGVTIEVSPEDHSAILRGAVPSEHDRQTTELLVMLEPGIQTVVNDLTVDPSLPPIQNRRRSTGDQRAPGSRSFRMR